MRFGRFSENWKQARGEAASEIDAVVGDAEAVFLAQAVIGGLEVGRLVQLERQSKRVQCRTPIAPFAIGAREHDEGIGLVGGVGRVLIGDIGRGGRPLVAGGAVVLVGGRDLEPEIGGPAPGRRVLRRDGHDLHVDVGGAVDVALSQRGVGVLLERGDRLVDGARLVLEVGLKLRRRHRRGRRLGRSFRRLGGDEGVRTQTDGAAMRPRGGRAGIDSSRAALGGAGRDP